MTQATDTRALMALAHAYDREDAAQRGEPDPWPAPDTTPTIEDVRWTEERIACAEAGVEAYRAALAQGAGVAALVDSIPDEQLRHIADSKDTGACRARIRSALVQGAVEAEPGWRLVPDRMTAAMINAWSNGPTVSSDEVAFRTPFQEAWARVLAAAPQPSTSPPLERVTRERDEARAQLAALSREGE